MKVDEIIEFLFGAFLIVATAVSLAIAVFALAAELLRSVQ